MLIALWKGVAESAFYRLKTVQFPMAACQTQSLLDDRIFYSCRMLCSIVTLLIPTVAIGFFLPQEKITLAIAALVDKGYVNKL
jgi:hypothetical protein